LQRYACQACRHIERDSICRAAEFGGPTVALVVRRDRAVAIEGGTTPDGRLFLAKAAHRRNACRHPANLCES